MKKFALVFVSAVVLAAVTGDFVRAQTQTGFPLPFNMGPGASVTITCKAAP